MNAKTRTVMTLVAVMLILGLFSLGRTTSAHSPHCRQVKGNLMDVSTPNGVVGTLTKGGLLNGTYELLNHMGPISTPDPNTISYTLDFVLTTNHQGQLKSSDVGIYDFVTGVFSEIARINPNTSTGRFAGATGVLITSGKSTDGGATFQSEITGEICFAFANE